MLDAQLSLLHAVVVGAAATAATKMRTLIRIVCIIESRVKHSKKLYSTKK